MQKDGGVYKIPCVVNGLKLKFIFDTGASNVCISLSEANLMLDNGYLDKKDIIGKGQAQIADGSIIDNTRIILREIKINDLILKDVEAVVVHELTAPLLLGQSAIEKLGKIQIEGDEMIVLNAKGNNYTDTEISEMFTQAVLNYGDKMYIAAADTFQKIYDMQRLGEITAHEFPVLLAPSRKRFIGAMLGNVPPEELDEGTVATCITGVFQGVDMVRVHNVKMHKRALAVADGLLRGE